MGRKRFYDAVRDLIRDGQEEPESQRPRLSIESLLAAPVKCAVCWEQIPEQEKVPFSCNACLGAYCSECLQDYGRAALKDKFILPLRCSDIECGSPIPISSVTSLLAAAEAEQLTRFHQEHNAPSEEKLKHSAVATPAEEEKELLLNLMHSLGWRQCPDCGMGIERTHGCAHMICICGFQFCYSCGNPWNDCGRRCRMFRTDLYEAGLPPFRHAFNMIQHDFDVLRDDVWARIVETINDLRAILTAEEEAAAAPRPRARGVLPALPILAIVADQYVPGTEAIGGEQVATREAVRAPMQSSGKMSVGALVHPHHI